MGVPVVCWLFMYMHSPMHMSRYLKTDVHLSNTFIQIHVYWLMMSVEFYCVPLLESHFSVAIHEAWLMCLFAICTLVIL